MLRLKKTNFWSRRFHETAISDFEMVTATTLIFHGYILTSLFFQILSISTTSKRTDLGFSLSQHDGSDQRQVEGPRFVGHCIGFEPDKIDTYMCAAMHSITKRDYPCTSRQAQIQTHGQEHIWIKSNSVNWKQRQKICLRIRVYMCMPRTTTTTATNHAMRQFLCFFGGNRRKNLQHKFEVWGFCYGTRICAWCVVHSLG